MLFASLGNLQDRGDEVNAGFDSEYVTRDSGEKCQTSPGATVKDQPELVSNISRICVNDQVEPECPASPGAAQKGWVAGNRTLNLRIKSPGPSLNAWRYVPEVQG
jgi:hypothetical protein